VGWNYNFLYQSFNVQLQRTSLEDSLNSYKVSNHPYTRKLIIILGQ
jgi:hypothetical protein